MYKLFFICFSFLVFLAMAQPMSKEPLEPEIAVKLPGQDSIFHSPYVDTIARFPGGQKAMLTYFTKKQNGRDTLRNSAALKHPDKAFVRVVVEKNGTLSDIKVMRGIDPESDKEVVAFVKAMPRWKPAWRHRKKVRSYFIFPVKYRPAAKN